METALAKKDLSSRVALLASEIPLLYPIGERSIYRKISEGTFPAPDGRILGRKVWKRETLEAWIAKQ